MNQRIDTKESKENHLHLLNRFNIFSDIESMTQLKNYFLPKIEKFCFNIDELEKNN